MTLTNVKLAAALTASVITTLALSAAEMPTATANPPVSSVTGLILDAKTKQPVPGLPVFLSNGLAGALQPLPGEATLHGNPAATTDAQGRYALRFTLSGRQRLELALSTTSSNYSSGNISVAIYPGESVEARPIEVSRFASARVHVVDPHGQPVAGAKVSNFGFNEGVTGADGCFTDTRVPPQGHFSWTVAAPGYELMGSTYSAEDPRSREPTIQLVPCKTVTGTVAAADGTPARNVRVYAGGYASLNVLPNWWVPVDDQGRYCMNTMLAKGATLWIFPVRGTDTVGEPLQVEPGQTNISLKLYAVGKLEVLVRDEAGNPIENAQIRAMQKNPDGSQNYNKIRWGKADKEGKAVIDALPAGNTKVELVGIPSMTPRFHPMPGVDATVIAGAVAHGTLTYLPQAQKNPVISGFLVDTRGQPVRHARVGASLKLEEKGIGVNRGESWTEVDGRFEVSLPYDSGARDGLPAWEAPAPEKTGQFRLVATIGNYRHALDVTRAWPKDETRLDAGRIVVPFLAEWSLAEAHGRADADRTRLTDLAAIPSPELTGLFPEARFYALTLWDRSSKSGPQTHLAAMAVCGTNVTFLASDEESARYLSTRAAPATGKEDALQVAKGFCALRDFEIRTEPPTGTTPGANDDWSIDVKPDGNAWNVSLTVLIDSRIQYCRRYTLTIDAKGTVTATGGKPVGTALGGYG